MKIVNANERLMIEVYTVKPLTLHIGMNIKVHPFQNSVPQDEEFIIPAVNANGSKQVKYFPLSNIALDSISVSTNDAGINFGECFIRFSIESNGKIRETLIQNMVSSNASACYPTSSLINPRNEEPFLLKISYQVGTQYIILDSSVISFFENIVMEIESGLIYSIFNTSNEKTITMVITKNTNSIIFSFPVVFTSTGIDKTILQFSPYSNFKNVNVYQSGDQVSLFTSDFPKMKIDSNSIIFNIENLDANFEYMESLTLFVKCWLKG
jgi:hypothetical protein